MIDENVSERLIGQAFEVMFKEFERYIKIMKMFKGVDWTIYVKMRNKERKSGEAKKEYFDENLLDEDDVEEKKEEKKEEVAPKDGEAEPEKKDEEAPMEEKPEGDEAAAEEKKDEE